MGPHLRFGRSSEDLKYLSCRWNVARRITAGPGDGSPRGKEEQRAGGQQSSETDQKRERQRAKKPESNRERQRNLLTERRRARKTREGGCLGGPIYRLARAPSGSGVDRGATLPPSCGPRIGGPPSRWASGRNPSRLSGWRWRPSRWWGPRPGDPQAAPPPPSIGPATTAAGTHGGRYSLTAQRMWSLAPAARSA